MGRVMFFDKKGAIMIVAMGLSLLMAFFGIAASNMLLQDQHMIDHLKRTTQARYLAEAGISSALGVLLQQGFAAKDDANNFPLINLEEGSFDVTVIQNGGRVLLSCVGTVEGVSQTASLEVTNNTSEALDYCFSAGHDTELGSVMGNTCTITGKVHANNSVDLFAAAMSHLVITDSVTASDGDIDIWTRLFSSVKIGSTTYGDWTDTTLPGGAPTIGFPSFDFAYYKGLAQLSGDYYTDDTKVFGSHGATTNLTPANGIIYCEGTAEFRGTVNLTGGIIADEIKVVNKWNWFFLQSKGILNQLDSGINRNVIISRTKDIKLWGELNADNSSGTLVYAGDDFTTFSALSKINVKGLIMAGGDINMLDFISQINYTYVQVLPDGMESSISIVSWND